MVSFPWHKFTSSFGKGHIKLQVTPASITYLYRALSHRQCVDNSSLKKGLTAAIAFQVSSYCTFVFLVLQFPVPMQMLERNQVFGSS